MADAPARSAEDFVIATGQQYSVRQFIEWTAHELGFSISFSGEGGRRWGWCRRLPIESARLGSRSANGGAGRPALLSPTEVETLLGDPTKAKERLGWVPEITAQAMCAEMVAHDLEEARKRALLKRHGFQVDVRASSAFSVLIVCHVVDHYGDAGVCLRLAKGLLQGVAGFSWW